jgi:UDP-N-acetylglucosamine/UDP-N-acetylgalactosamine diphosphorylase
MENNNPLDVLIAHNQYDIINYYNKLRTDKKDLFLRRLRKLDLQLVMKLHRQFLKSSPNKPIDKNMIIKTAPIIPVPKSNPEKEKAYKAKQIGEALLRDGKVAVLIVAGGQGSRLGFDGPKGFYAISPIRHKPLFQIFSEQIGALSKRYLTTIPLIIMTSEENHDPTVRFFENNAYFGLNKDKIYFFSQDVLPAITPDGNLVLSDNHQLFTNPNGHGGSLKGLYDSGILKMFVDKKYTTLFYCQVDNPLVKIADPVFLGYHTMANADVSTKVVRRRSVEEKVGVYLSRNGKDAIIEYSDMAPENMSALDEKSNILYWAGNTAIHVFSLPFIQRINDHGFGLPYHCARKHIDVIHKNGKSSKTDVWKFETFVFDAIPLAERTCCMEIIREEEFSPVNNKNGPDSPQTARSAMVNLYRGWLKKAGIHATPQTVVEISPFFALDENEFIDKVRSENLTVSSDTYFGE